MASRSTVCVCITIPSFPAPLRKTPSLLLKHQFLLMKQPKDGEGGGVPSRSRGRRGPGSPARAGRGGGEGHSHARSPCPPRHSGSGRAGVPGRAGGTRWWRKGPPREGRSKRGPGGHAACWGHGRDTSLRGGGGRHRGAGGPALCWVGGEGGGERTHMATQAPRPPPGALSPPRCSPGELCPYLRSPQRCSPCLCHSSVAGTVGAAVFPLRGAGGKDGAPMGRVGSGDPRWLRGRGAAWGPGTPTGSASHEPSAGGWVTVGLGQTPRGSGWIGGGRGVAGAQVGPAKRSA